MKTRIQPTALFLIIIALAGFILPLLFIQRGSVANTIQFSYYSLVIANFAAAYWLVHFLEKKNLISKILFTSLVFLFALPTTAKVFTISAFSKERLKITPDEVSALRYLKSKTPTDSIILLPPSERNTHSLYVSALSARRTFYSDRLMSENTQKDFKEREGLARKFFSTQDFDWSRSFLKNYQVAYIYFYPEDVSDFNPEQLSLKEILQADKIKVYKVEK